jgi:hypothetical protein
MSLMMQAGTNMGIDSILSRLIAQEDSIIFSLPSKVQILDNKHCYIRVFCTNYVDNYKCGNGAKLKTRPVSGKFRVVAMLSRGNSLQKKVIIFYTPDCLFIYVSC